MGEESFYPAEYKCLREEVGAALKARQEFNKWGLIGLGALYSFIFSNLDKQWAFPALFWVPVGLAAAMLWHMLDINKMIAKAGKYIRLDVEPWMRGEKNEKGENLSKKPRGWETFLEDTKDDKEPSVWGWSPVPLWRALTLLTGVLAIVLSLGWYTGWRPSTVPSAVDNKPVADIQSLKKELNARLDEQTANLSAKIESERASFSAEFDDFKQLLESIPAIVKALLPNEAAESKGPITISISGNGGGSTLPCGRSTCCCSAAPQDGPSCGIHGRSRHRAATCP